MKALIFRKGVIRKIQKTLDVADILDSDTSLHFFFHWSILYTVYSHSSQINFLKEKVEYSMKSERQNKIINLLFKNGFVKTSNLKETFGVSIETIRRDFNQLSKMGFLVKTYGGAVITNKHINVKSDLETWQRRMDCSLKEKRAIALRAIEYIEDHILLAMDSGTTILELAKLLNQRNGITIITNDLNSAEMILQNNVNQVFLLGGMVTANGSTDGYFAKHLLNSFSKIDMYIFSCDGVNIEDGFTTSSLESNELKRLLAEKAIRKIALVDHTKFGKKALFKISGFDQVDVVITDSNTPQGYIDQIREKGIQVDLVTVDERVNFSSSKK